MPESARTPFSQGVITSSAFSVRFANLVAYVTTSWGTEPPRLTAEQIREFLDCIRQLEPSTPPLISTRDDWVRDARSAAEESWTVFSQLSLDDEGDFLRPEDLHAIIGPLEPLLADHSLFALACGDAYVQDELKGLSTATMAASREHVLFLIPTLEQETNQRAGSQTIFETLDPFPGLARFAEEPGQWPGVLFWSRTGQSAVVPLKGLAAFYKKLRSVLVAGVEAIDGVLKDYPRLATSKKILHLSDLHFGSKYASKHHAYLSAHLRGEVQNADRVVITGDLFNNPSKRNAKLFEGFQGELIAMVKDSKNLISILGNHDESWMGNRLGSLGKRLEVATSLQLSKLVVDDRLKCLFFCFDSALEAAFSARGCVSMPQLQQMGTMFEQECGPPNDKRRNYLKVALVHHHPFSFGPAGVTDETTKMTIVARIGRTFKSIFTTDHEAFLGMDNAEEFVTWCAQRGVSVVLHGHKHIAHYAVQKVTSGGNTGAEEGEVTAIGCGSSLGMDKSPVAYDLVAWDEGSRKWGVTFYSDPGNHSNFHCDSVALTQVPPFS
jgi:predicted phosphodiesterase